MKTLSLCLGLALVACGSSKGGTSGGTSGGASTTTGGTTSGADPTTCSSADAGGGQAELTECFYNADCACPAACVVDAVRGEILAEGAADPESKYCEVACQTNADCDLPSTVCKGGTCVEVPCGNLDDAGAHDDFGYPCDAIGTADGTCFGNAFAAGDPSGGAGETLTLIPNGLPAACWVGGSATSACTVLAPPSALTERCGVGAACIPSLPSELAATGFCLSTCDASENPPAGAPSCAAGESCIELPLLGPAVDAYGVCVTPGDGGCLGGLPTGQSELQGCYSGESCACPEVCVSLDGGATGLATGVCELPCASSADCSNPATACNAGLCSYESCAGETCAFQDAGPGTCLPPSFSWFATQPFCVAAGTQATGQACDPRAAQTVIGTGLFGPLLLPGVPALAGNEVCAPGLLCVAEADGGSACAPACTADGGSCGDGGLICYPVDTAGDGFCGACSATAAACSSNAQCCSGSCAPSGACN